MSPAKSDDPAEDIIRPRRTTELFGHAEAERVLLDAYRSGRIPHAWLIGGERGIGKATLAYRMARFVLAHPDPAAPVVQKAATLAVAPDHPASRRIAGEAHAGLLAMRRVINEKTGKLFTEIRVDDVRRSVTFFGNTAGEGGWRVAIVDPVDELNAAGENALLKILEEPPARSLLLLVAHAPGRVLPTIRSRCRMLLLRPLAAEQVARAAAAALGARAAAAALDERTPTAEIRAAAEAADGSVGRALTLLEGDALELRKQVMDALARLPRLDPSELHALGDEIAGTGQETLAIFTETVNAWLSARLAQGGQNAGRLAHLAEVWESVNQAARDADEYNLDRKPLVFSVFSRLAEAARA